MHQIHFGEALTQTELVALSTHTASPAGFSKATLMKGKGGKGKKLERRSKRKRQIGKVCPQMLNQIYNLIAHVVNKHHYNEHTTASNLTQYENNDIWHHWL